MKQAEKRKAASGSTVLKEIPGPLKEPDGQEDSTPTAQVGLLQPIGAEESLLLDGGKTSVFANLAEESEGLAVEAEAPPCNPEESAQAVSPTVRPFGSGPKLLIALNRYIFQVYSQIGGVSLCFCEITLPAESDHKSQRM